MEDFLRRSPLMGYRLPSIRSFFIRFALHGSGMRFGMHRNKPPKSYFRPRPETSPSSFYPDRAPKTVENFVQYVKDKHYNGTIFHRVIPNFMVQGGGFTSAMQQKATRALVPLKPNNKLKNDRGTIAMARTSDPNSATAQFFINVVDNQNLNAPRPDGYGYTVFGKRDSRHGHHRQNPYSAHDQCRHVPDVPQTPIVINSASIGSLNHEQSSSRTPYRRLRCHHP